MEQITDYRQLLEYIREPAFLAENGKVLCTNYPASQCGINPDCATDVLIDNGAEDYAAFQGGKLYLMLRVQDQRYPCTVTRLQQIDLFVLQTQTLQPQLQALSLAATQLSRPMADIFVGMGALDVGQNASGIGHQLMQLQRIIGNMADAVKLLQEPPQLLNYDVIAIIQETLEKAKTLLSESGLAMEYRINCEPVLTLADDALLRRGIYNLLSNAVKFSPTGSTVYITVHADGKRIYIRCLNNIRRGEDTDNCFDCYTREPAIENPHRGLGLGMTIIRTAAAAHDGTVLLEQPEDDQLAVTMTLTIKTGEAGQLRSPILRPDAYGGWDSAMIELSEILPGSLYRKK